MTFNRTVNVSKYFILTTIKMDQCDVGAELQELRRDLLLSGYTVPETFHATTDAQIIRDEVFKLIQGHDFEIDATILEKSKAQPHIRATKPGFYQTAWYFHFKHVGPRVFEPEKPMILTAASIGTKKEKGSFKSAVDSVANQILPANTWAVDFPRSQTEPCLQIADYACWAIQRKWERNDDRSYKLIADKIKSEFDLWRRGSTHYY